MYINIKSFLWEFFMALQGNKHGVIIEQMSELSDLKTMNPFGSDSTITKKHQLENGTAETVKHQIHRKTIYG